MLSDLFLLGAVGLVAWTAVHVIRRLRQAPDGCTPVEPAGEHPERLGELGTDEDAAFDEIAEPLMEEFGALAKKAGWRR